MPCFNYSGVVSTIGQNTELGDCHAAVVARFSFSVGHLRDSTVDNEGTGCWDAVHSRKISLLDFFVHKLIVNVSGSFTVLSCNENSSSVRVKAVDWVHVNLWPCIFGKLAQCMLEEATARVNRQWRWFVYNN